MEREGLEAVGRLKKVSSKSNPYLSVSSNRFSVKPLRPISIQVTKKTESLPGKIVHACKKTKTVCVIM